jgi:hypothetical protein
MLVLALEFSRVTAARVDRNHPALRCIRDARGASGGGRHVAEEAAEPLPQNGRARSDAHARSCGGPAGVSDKALPAAGSWTTLTSEPISQCSTG